MLAVNSCQAWWGDLADNASFVRSGRFTNVVSNTGPLDVEGEGLVLYGGHAFDDSGTVNVYSLVPSRGFFDETLGFVLDYVDGQMRMMAHFAETVEAAPSGMPNRIEVVDADSKHLGELSTDASRPCAVLPEG